VGELKECCICGNAEKELVECEICGQLYCEDCEAEYNQFSQIDYNCCERCATRDFS
jgi:hypothetical protein